jgi:hypothetical protein
MTSPLFVHIVERNGFTATSRGLDIVDPAPF